MSRGHPSIVQIVDIQQVVATAIRLVAPTARSRAVTITSEPMDPGRLRVRADEAELHHVVVNLLLNAVQACQSGGLVTIRAGNGGAPDGWSVPDRASRAPSVTIAISDNGCGIAHEHLDRIFEPFFSARPGGTGLGLFLSLNFIRRCGGDIAVESAVGRGSTFSIVLPAMSDAAEYTPA
jgi:signal transduction histidine kinase